MLSYPITQDIHDARRRFPEIDRAVNIPYSGRSELEIVRVARQYALRAPRTITHIAEQTPAIVRHYRQTSRATNRSDPV